MKLKLILLAGVAAATLLVSCGKDDAAEHACDCKDHPSHSTSAEQDDGLGGLVLENGARWKMDDHTRSAFAGMITSFQNHDLGSLDEDGLKKAGADLQTRLDELIRGCTMTGKAHDQLHVYLTGYIPAVAALAESGRIEDGKRVAHYLVKYGEYFE